ncbi:MAG: HAD family hydrolase [Ignavibacteria bacterium]|nr:MAG: HAD family hydrolase [Ignavibacteria bacterium]
MTRDDAIALLHEYTESDSLRKHAYAVEGAMRAYAEQYGEDAEEWGLVGLLHDFDYEKHPAADEHPFVGNRILEERGYPEHIRRAIMSHAEYTGVTRESLMEKTLFAVDELCGFLMAVSYVRPDRSIASVQVKSVKKKMKDKGFARAVSREDMLRGAEELGVPFEEHVAFTIAGLTRISESLGV